MAGLLTSGLDLHVLIVFHCEAVFYNSCILVDGIGLEVQVPAQNAFLSGGAQVFAVFA